MGRNQSNLIEITPIDSVVEKATDDDCTMAFLNQWSIVNKTAAIKDLIVSYHPIIFNDLKKITTDSGYVQKSIIKAVKNNISVYAIHTSLDNHPEGISYFLSKKIGLKFS